jgi:hypothetical protein
MKLERVVVRLMNGQIETVEGYDLSIYSDTGCFGTRQQDGDEVIFRSWPYHNVAEFKTVYEVE